MSREKKIKLRSSLTNLVALNASSCRLQWESWRIAWPLQEAMSSKTAEISAVLQKLWQLHQSPAVTPKYLCSSGVACKHLGKKPESNSWLHLSGKKYPHRVMDVNTEWWMKSQGDSATGLNSFATTYTWILTQVMASWVRWYGVSVTVAAMVLHHCQW